MKRFRILKKLINKREQNKRKRFLFFAVVGSLFILSGIGGIFALNGFFGGVPERTAILLLPMIGVGLMLMVATSKKKSFSFGTAPKNPSRITKLAIIAAVILTLGVGGTFALNGFFGGGAAIPEDTFTRGLVGYWPMDEATSTIAYDKSGKNNHGALVNNPQWTSGKNSGGIYFDGKDNYVNTNVSWDTLLNGGTSDFTIEAYVKYPPQTNPGANYKGIIGTYADSLSTGLWIDVVNDTLRFRLKGTGSPTGAAEIQAGIKNDNNWHHIMVTASRSSTASFYVDGVLKGTTDITAHGGAIGASIINFGKITYYYKGALDEVRIYNRALSVAEAKYHYNHGGPAGYWKFDEGSGTVSRDETENSNDGALTNFNSTDAGTAEAGASMTLADNDKTWISNQWARGSISITGGTGSGQARSIVSNNATTITVSLAWGTNPDATSVYSLSQAGAWTEGKYGSAIQFDGYNDYINVGNKNSITGAITIEAWIKPSANLPAEAVIIKKSPDDCGNYALQLNNYKLAFLSSNNCNWVYKGGNSTVVPDVWQHVAVTASGGTMKYYINGVNTDTITSWTVGATNSNSLTIGGYAGAPPVDYFNGAIDDVKISDYARTAEEIRLDYQAGMATYLGPSGKTCSQDPASCINQNLVGYWDMEEGKGTSLLDKSGNGNNGTLTNGPKWSVGAPLAGGRGSLAFDGKDDYTLVNDSDSLDIANNITVSLWVKRLGNGLNVTPGLISKRVAQSGWGLMWLTDPKSDYVNMRLYQSDLTPIQFTNVTQIGINEWHLLTLTADSIAKKVKAYKDGVLIQENNYDGTIKTGTSPLYIGQQSSAYFNGLIDEVRIYGRALSAEEIRYQYNHGGPVAYWKFDEGSGAIAKDSSLNNNDGAISGATWISGKYGNALSFDGADDFVDIPSNPNLNFYDNADFTLQAWYKGTDTGQNGNFGKGLIAWNNNSFFGALVLRSGYAEYIHSNESGWQHNIKSDTLVADNNWHHIVYVNHHNKTGDLYIDGAIHASNEDSSMVYLGISYPFKAEDIMKGFSGLYTSGLIDEVKIFNYGRTAEEIRKDYEQGMQTYFGPTSKTCSEDPESCMNQGLVGYWNMEENNGTSLLDRSGNGNNGTLTNGPKWSTGAPLASGRGSLSFDGKNDYVYIGNNISISSYVSIEAWVKLKNFGQGNTGTVIRKGSAGNDWFIRKEGANNYLTLRVYNSTGGLANVNGPVMSNDVWYHLVGVYDGANVSFYVNGALSSEAPLTGQISNNSVASAIGSHQFGSSEFINGLIDEVRIYNRALSPEEVRYHYNQGGPVGWWEMDEGKSNKAYDQTENNNDGTLGDGTCQPGAGTCPVWTQGKYGSALDFDGTDDYVNLGNSSKLDLTNNMTAEAWIYTEAAGTNTIISKGGASIAQSTFWMDLRSNNSLIYFGGYTPGGAAAYMSSSYNFQMNRWYHVAGVDNGTNLIIYVNGVEVGRGARSTRISGSWDVRLGSRGTYGNPWNGLIDDAKIYNYARTPLEIQKDYQLGLAAHLK